MPIQTSPLEEIAAIRRMCNTQWSLPAREILTAVPEVYGTVTGFFNKSLGLKESEKDLLIKEANRRRRCNALELFIGRPINSFKKLTQHECTVLLDQLKAQRDDDKLRLSEHGMQLIQWADEYVIDNPNYLELEEPNDRGSTELSRTPQAAQTKVMAQPRTTSEWPADLSDLW